MIKVLIVDDSPLIQALLADIIGKHPKLEVCGIAGDPLQARDLIKQLRPDVITLDIEMPKMDGITFLKNLMRLRPMPVVMVSTLTQHGAELTLQALEIGAFDYVPKPEKSALSGLSSYTDIIHEKLLAAVKANVTGGTLQKDLAQLTTKGSLTNKWDLIAIGASTGGTEAIKRILQQLPASMPPIVITQHIKPEFSAAFANRLNQVCALDVFSLDKSSTPISNGQVWVAPGDEHMRVSGQKGALRVKSIAGEKVNRHRPAVDELFDSIVKIPNLNVLAILLTGMGKDGARGLLTLKEYGAYTVAQDQESSVVWGMPGAAHEIGADCELMPLADISHFLVSSCYR